MFAERVCSITVSHPSSAVPRPRLHRRLVAPRCADGGRRPPNAQPVVLPATRLVPGVAGMVAATRAVSVAGLLAPARGTAKMARARQIAIYLLHVEAGMPVSRVAILMGRDRATVRHACRVIEDLREEPALDAELDRLRCVLARLSAVMKCGSIAR